MELNNEIEIRSLIGDLHIESREGRELERPYYGVVPGEDRAGRVRRVRFVGHHQPQHRFDSRPHNERDAAIGGGRRGPALRIRGSQYDAGKRYAGAGTSGRRLEMFIPLRRRAGRVAVCRRKERPRDGRANDT